MAGDCTYNTYYENDDTFCLSNPLPNRARERTAATTGGSGASSPKVEIIDGLLYRKKLERGSIQLREILDQEDQRQRVISTFHRRRADTQHVSLEDTYKAVAENYWWDGMYFHIRDYVLGCPECMKRQNQRTQDRGNDKERVSKTVMSHSRDVLGKLQSQREAGRFCDITLRTDRHSYSAHKAVLAAVSEYFQEAFDEMDSAPNSKSDIDLTGFSEEGLLSLLDFSYSSTLSVCLQDLPEVSTMARHLGMWPAVEACLALQREQGESPSLRPSHRHLSQDFLPPSPACLQPRLRESRKRPREEDFGSTHDQLDESALAQSPRRSPRAPHRPTACTPEPRALAPTPPLSPPHRWKLMDFKSPSKSTPPRNSPSETPTTARLLRSTPGAAQTVQRLLPRPESPRANRRRSASAPRPSPRPTPGSRPSPRPTPGSRQRPGVAAPQVRVKQEQESEEEEEDQLRVLEKYHLMNVLGLQRTSLLPGPEELIGWRQKKRLRKLKANNYSLTKRRKPLPQVPALAYGSLPLSLPLCNPINVRFLQRVIKTEPGQPISMEAMRMKRPRSVPRPVPPSERSMRSQRASPTLLQPISRPAFGGRELRLSVRGGGGAPLSSRPPPHQGGTKIRTGNNLRIKTEPFDYGIPVPPLPAHCRRGVTHARSPCPPSTSSRNRFVMETTSSRSSITAETPRTIRYNSGRPVAKRSGGRDVGKAQRRPSKEHRRTSHRPTSRRPSQEDHGHRPTLRRPSQEDHGHRPTPRRPSQEDRGHRPTTQQGLEGATGNKRHTGKVPSPDPNLIPPFFRAIKEEPADPFSVGMPFPEPPSPDLGKRQSKPPVKLLDPGFLFSFCRPSSGPVVGVKREEESVDICLTRSVSQGERFGAGGGPGRVLRARGHSSIPTAPTLSRVKREGEERGVTQSRMQGANSHHHKHQPHSQHKSHLPGRPLLLTNAAGSKAARDKPKKQSGCLPQRGSTPALREAIRRARLKQLRGHGPGRGRGSSAPNPAHYCPDCHASYRDCDAMIMHRIRHVEGKHWPCPVCSKTFFRQKNVRNHMRTHDQRLYLCRSCIAAS